MEISSVGLKKLRETLEKNWEKGCGFILSWRFLEFRWINTRKLACWLTPERVHPRNV